jgi:hypothetical protein
MSSDPLLLDRLALGGDAVARLPSTEPGRPGQVVFVPFGAPGDRVVLSSIRKENAFARGWMGEMIDPSRPCEESPGAPFFFSRVACRKRCAVDAIGNISRRHPRSRANAPSWLKPFNASEKLRNRMWKTPFLRPPLTGRGIIAIKASSLSPETPRGNWWLGFTPPGPTAWSLSTPAPFKTIGLTERFEPHGSGSPSGTPLSMTPPPKQDG